MSLLPKGIILGQMKDTAYNSSSLKLQKSDRFVQYADGSVEALTRISNG